VNESGQSRVVVGVSGSLASKAALQWAAAEAALRGATLHVVRAWEPARRTAPYAVAGARLTGTEDRDAVRDGLAATMLAAFGPVTPDGVTAELAEGAPERVIVSRSADADLLVLGSSPASYGDDQPGSVVRACLKLALCPVVVIGIAHSAALAAPAAAPVAAGREHAAAGARHQRRHAGLAGRVSSR